MTTCLSLSLSPSTRPLALRAWFHCPSLSSINFTISYTSSQSQSQSQSLVKYSSKADFRRRSPIIAFSSDYHRSMETRELIDESYFESLLSSDGHVSICGFGSLLSGMYCYLDRRRRCCCSVYFGTVRLRGFLFATREKREEYVSGADQLQNCKVEWIQKSFRSCCSGFLRAWNRQNRDEGFRFSNDSTMCSRLQSFNLVMEISSLSVEPFEGENLIVTVFEIKKTEIPAFLERELEFRFLAVLPETLDGKQYDHPAVLCARYSDEEFFQVRCKGSKDIYFQLYGRFSIDRIWRDDILPCRAYLRHCVLAAKNLGVEAYNNFLDHTYLGDRKTTIREYLATTGSGIMEEEPPESLKTRYGG